MFSIKVLLTSANTASDSNLRQSCRDFDHSNSPFYREPTNYATQHNQKHVESSDDDGSISLLSLRANGVVKSGFYRFAYIENLK